MKLPVLLILALAALTTAAHAAPLALYVSPKGSDAATGSSKSPMATLDGARARLRTLKTASKLPKEGVTVWLAEGDYPLRDTWKLGPEDDLSPIPVTYAAAKGKTVRVTGGQSVANWTRVTDNAVLDRIDPSARTHVWQSDLKAQGVTNYGAIVSRGFGRPLAHAALELFYNDAPMTLARWPNEGSWAMTGGKESESAEQHFGYTDDRPARWTKAEDAWVHGYWSFDWADSYEQIQTIDTQKKEITTVGKGAFGYSGARRWYALNLLEELDAPGEWYLDRKTGILYFWPPKGDAPTGKAVVSIANDLIVLDHVSNVTLRGLTLEDCRGRAVTINGGARNVIDGCTIRDCGNHGAEISDTTDSGVRGCRISETGDGGVILSGGDRKTLAPGRNFVENCRIERYSRWSRTYRAGVVVSGVGNHIAHCLISDAPHNAILLSGNDHVIEYNEIHHVCQETGDSGAFYMGRDWTMRGDIVRFNYFHDLGGAKGLQAGGVNDVQAIYLDDTAAGATVFGNICVRAGRGALVGGGRDNILDNNIFVDCRTAISLDDRGLGWAAKSLLPGGDWNMQANLAAVGYDKPPYSTRYPHLANILQDDPNAPKYNTIRHNISVRCTTWLDLSEKAKPGITISNNLTNADPLFVNEKQGDYRLKSKSPAFKLGFQAIPFDRIGPIPPPK
ncbi:MAG: right-handed parallel beta-helix repeat-containing protein [Capsulimonas sp.]|uniref:right-handed parallel beta-helix repeat-containing protein n=1 Tax=Capsulimonas sp. TaxID=2494211 RepID=UPI00326353E3